MAEGSVETGNIPSPGKLNRRSLLHAGVGAIGVTLAVGAEAKTGILSNLYASLGKALEAFFNRPTEAQVNAARELAREDVVKSHYRVKDSPTIRTNGGLPAKVEPKTLPKGEPPVRVLAMLQPGDEIFDAIEWRGTNTTNPARGDTNSWLAFRDSRGRIVFVEQGDEYLEPLVDANLSPWDRPAVSAEAAARLNPQQTPQTFK